MENAFKTHHRQYVGVREDPELGELLVKVPLYARRAFSDGNKLRHDVVLLPSAAPCLAWRSESVFIKKSKPVIISHQRSV